MADDHHITSFPSTIAHYRLCEVINSLNKVELKVGLGIRPCLLILGVGNRARGEAEFGRFDTAVHEERHDLMVDGRLNEKF